MVYVQDLVGLRQILTLNKITFFEIQFDFEH